MRIHRLADEAAWTALKEACRGRCGILLVKLSPICPVSAAAERAFDAWAAAQPESPGFETATIDVIGARSLSRGIASELGVRHESPQVLWLGPGLSVLWHASHDAITRESLQARFPSQ